MKRSKVKPEGITNEVTSNFDSLVFDKNHEKLVYSLAKCCNPIPGDKVFGFITIKDGIKVHKHNCPNALSLQSQYSYRVISAKWVDSTQEGFNVTLSIIGIDNLGLINDVTRVISTSLNVNIHNINISGNEGFFRGQITVSIKNNKQLTDLIGLLKKIDGIEKVERIVN